MHKFTRRDFIQTLGAGSAGLFLMGLPNRRRLLFGNTILDQKDVKELDDKSEYDICIVGSGPAGAVLASKLARHNMRTLVLESGYDPYMTSPVPGLGKLDAYSSSGEIDYLVASTRFRGLGGTSNLWSGICPRMLPHDFEMNPYTPSDATWPVRYDDLEPYYQKAEEELHVIGKKSNRYSPPRTSDFPFEPESKQDVSGLQDVLNDIGLAVEHMPLAWSSEYNGPLKLVESHVPHLNANSYVTLVPGATATKIIIESTGEVTGLEIRSLNGEVKIIRSCSYVLACGGVETPRLLLLSQSPEFPEGIGNNYDLVGRFFMEHPDVANVRGRVKGHSSSLFKRGNKRAISHQFEAEFKSRGLGSVVLLFDYWGLQLRTFDGKNPFDSIGDMIDAYRRPSMVIQTIMEMEPQASNRIVLDHKNKDFFGNPGARLSFSFSENDQKTIEESTKLLKRIASDLDLEDLEIFTGVVDWSHHHIGTCRMGDNPRTNVVDKNLRVHGTNNLFVIGSSVFVTSGAVMPTLTIVALSLRLADQLLSNFKKNKTKDLKLREFAEESK